MVEQKVQVNNTYGLQARAASNFVSRARSYRADIYLEKDQVIYNGKSLMSVLAMAAGRGDHLIIRCDGQEEAAALSGLVHFLQEEIQQY